MPTPIAANEKLASGVSNTLSEANVWQTETFTPEMWWGHDYMHARYYSHSLGRFASVDPVGGSIGSSQSWNRYSYVQNNPLNLVDPDGEAPAGALTEQAVRSNMTAAEVEQFNEIQAKVEPVIVAGGMVAGAAITSATPAMATGAAVGFATSVVSVSTSDAPNGTKVMAVAAGTVAGFATGPMNFTLPNGVVSAIGSRLVADKVSGQAHMSGGQAAVEGVNGAGANLIAAMAVGLGPLGQIAVAGAAKYALDQGANAALSSEPSKLSDQQLAGAYRDFFGGSQ